MSILKDYLVKGFANFIVDLAVYISGKTLSSEILMTFVVTKSFTLPTDFVGSEAYASIGATSAVTFTIYRNESIDVGTVVFTAGSNTGVFSSSGDVSFISGDRLYVVNQVSADATLANISLTIRGNL